MRGEELARILRAKIKGDARAKIRGFSIDSRKIKEGEVFIALKGERYDGHDFVSDAFRRGAVGAVCEREVFAKGKGFLLKVSSTREALWEIARYRRASFRGEVIGVAGSVGKTTTKELLYHLLSSVSRTFRSEGNLNSQIGLPLVLSNMDTEANFAVLEMGASRRGEVLRLTQLARPRVRLITAIGEEHLESFGTLRDVIEGNGEIFHGFSEGDFAVLPAHLKKHYPLPEGQVITFWEGELKPTRVEVSVRGTLFSCFGEVFSVPVLSLAIVGNALAAFGVLLALGYHPSQFKEALSTFRTPRGRMNLYTFGDFYIVDDTYNANPLSVKNAVETVCKLEGVSKRIVILGDMLELGEKSPDLHSQIGAFMKEKGVDFGIFFGKETRYSYREFIRRGGKGVHLTDKGDVLEEMLKWFCDKNIILLKGSRSMRMETLLEDVRRVLGYGQDRRGIYL